MESSPARREQPNTNFMHIHKVNLTFGAAGSWNKDKRTVRVRKKFHMDEIKLTDVTALIIVQKLENKTPREPPQRHGCAKSWHTGVFLGNTRRQERSEGGDGGGWNSQGQKKKNKKRNPKNPKTYQNKALFGRKPEGFIQKNLSDQLSLPAEAMQTETECCPECEIVFRWKIVY